MSQGRLRWIYFLRRVSDGAVKIGRSTNPRRRRSALGGANALEFLGAFVGDGADEQALHSQFADLRIQGEWFTASPELEDFIACNALCDWESLTPLTKVTRLTAQPSGNKKTFGFSVNSKRPDEARLRIWLEQLENPSKTIKDALFIAMDGGQAAAPRIEEPQMNDITSMGSHELFNKLAPDTGAEFTRQERNELLLTIANLKQILEKNQAAPAATTTSGDAGQLDQAAPAASAPALSDAFLKAVKKAARPGIGTWRPEPLEADPAQLRSDTRIDGGT